MNNMKALLGILICVFCLLFVSCSKLTEPEKQEHFIVGEWKSVVEIDPNIENKSKFFLIFQPNKKVKISLRKKNTIVEENIYDYNIIDENTVKVDYAESLEIKKTSDNFHIKTECKSVYKSPPILCFNLEFEKIK